MKKLNIILVLVILLMASASFAEMIKVPANYDENGDCTDLVVAYGEKLLPIGGEWIFTFVDGNTYLNAKAFDPVKKLKKSTFSYEPSSEEKPADLGRQVDLIEHAGQVFGDQGIEAAAEVVRNSPLVENLDFVADTSIGVNWKEDGFEEVIFQTAEKTAAHQRDREPQPTPTELFIDALERGDGFVFGTDLRAAIPKIHKENFEASLDKMKQKTPLSLEEKKFLPVNHKGFLHDVKYN